MALIVLRLRPVDPVKGEEFAGYLVGLTIKAFDLAVNEPPPEEDPDPIGEASYIAPDDLTDPSDLDPSTRVVQHFESGVDAVATAVIEVTNGRPEHAGSDLRLEVTRGGGTILQDQVYYNVQETAGALPSDPADFPDLEPSGLFLVLPEPGQEIMPGDPFVQLPIDGTPPRFDDLLDAVEIVLGGDPGGTPDPAALTPEQARHVAYEIAWNQRFRPLPEPGDITFEEMYTAPKADDKEKFAAARAEFEGELAAYYATGNAEAERLAGFVYAVAAALDEQARSEQAQAVGFLLPVLPDATETGAQIKSVRVLLTDPADPLDPSFAVPAAYFYALGATAAPAVTAEDRYRLATLEDEDTLRTTLQAAVDTGVVDEDSAVNIEQAARRLRALGAVGGVAPGLVLDEAPAVQALVRSWLDFADDDINDFWDGPLTTQEAEGHLDLVLQALTDSHQPLIDAIKEKSPASVDDLAGVPAEKWRKLFADPDASDPDGIDETLLPSFTLPGSDTERVEAFIRHVQKFFAVDTTVADPDDPVLDPPPTFRALAADPITLFTHGYKDLAGVPFEFGGAVDQAHVADAVADVFPDDPSAQAWLAEAVRAIHQLALLAGGVPADLRFSVMEALYARGFTGLEQVRTLTLEQFAEALTGTVAYEHATAIHDRAGPAEPEDRPGDGTFHPVNPDNCLVDCIPPPHRSPFGAIAYLHELLGLAADSTCEAPNPGTGSPTLAELLADRRGPLADLLVTRANLETPLPLADLANESLEAMAATATPHGAVHDTAARKLGGHELLAPGASPDQEPYRHDPATLFAALPEHSTPATPVAAPDAYDRLRADFTDPLLPYPQALDVNRTYLGHLRTSRYAAMRRFRRDITELALDPANEPVEFQRHLWRYPVRIDTAREYLGISLEEHDLLYTKDIALSPTPGRLVLWELYGFPSEVVDGRPWATVVLRLPEFLERTGLEYCEFLELWEAEVVEPSGVLDRDFPGCEPCHLDDLLVLFEHPLDALRRLAVFLRLWRSLRRLPGGGYSFAELRDICEVLGLFLPDGSVNPDFIRQLAAFQILRDDLGLALTGGTEPAPGATGADRTHLLALWVGPTAASWEWAVDELLDQLQPYAMATHGCGTRPAEFRKLLAENLDPLSRLAGFDPAAPGDTWHARPTHTLRFAEVLAKLHASDFGMGEVLFLFTADDHLDGDDPFPLQPPNEALGSPLGLPDDERPFSLWDLRGKLLAVEVSEEDAAAWGWVRIDATLRTELGYSPPPGGPDPLLALGERFFPSVLEATGQVVPPQRRQYRVPLAQADTSPLLWNTPLGGPFRYDTSAEELWTALPLTDEAVIAKLSRVRQLNAAEQAAVRELYFLPRAALAPFALLFANLGEAEERLVQEPDEARRWAWFQRAFATAYARCAVIAEHLAGHVGEWTGRDHGEGSDLAWRLLRHLFADENRAAGPWEDDSGRPPAVTWPDQPSGGAFAALLGLVGTGLLGELVPDGGSLAWREVRGPTDAFGAEENAANAPVPTVLPAMDVTLNSSQERFVSVRNGFALANPDGTLVGGMQGYTARWSGILLIDDEGAYSFGAGAPTPDGQAPDFDAADDRRWRVQLRRGQRSWVLLSHDWPDETAPADRSAPLPLRRGAYQLTVELARPLPVYEEPEDVCPIGGGFQLKYAGPDSGDRMVALPHERLFRDQKREILADRVAGLDGAAGRFLALHFTSTLRDIRRTYQRAFKALLLAHRFALSARPVADDRQSEIGYLLVHAEDFTGTAYYRDGGGISVHRAYFDPNLLPVKDNYLAPRRAQDQRVAPSVPRQQAMFDWWERIFDYGVARREAATAPERPLWLLFHEAAERHPDDPAHLLRHLGVDLLHAPLVLRYFEGYEVTSADLEDERWALRAWHADRWVQALRAGFLVRDIREARPDLWAADDPGAVAASETETGNANLTRFLRDGCIENGEPRRYEDIRRLNDGLRERGRQALLAYLCGMDRVPLPWGGFATEPAHLSELLLQDVEAGLCQQASRVEEAVSAVQAFVQRARLGLEPDFAVPAAFALLWDRRFATYRTWEACRRQEVYLENWIDWEELEQARRSEGFRLLEEELRRATLTVPVPGGLEHWPDQRPPAHPGRLALQAREPAGIQPVSPQHHGFDLLGTPERHARPSWLATGLVPGQNVPTHPDGPVDPDGPGGPAGRVGGQGERLPMWVEAAVRLGVRFLRVAAAGEPPASTGFVAHGPAGEPACCVDCDRPHPAVVDEYWFWVLDARGYEAVAQDAGWSGWHDENASPRLLYWDAEPAVRLAWCRVHNGELTQPRRSAETVTVEGEAPELLLVGRTADSLTFEVPTGIAPAGHDITTPAGFRYDLATDGAVALPLVVAPTTPALAFPGKLEAYPYFAYFEPGAPLQPASPFAPAVTIAASLRTHCRFEAALKWLELAFAPLRSDSAWLRCPPERDDQLGGGCCHDGIVEAAADARQRFVVLHYLEILLQWADALMRRNTPEAFQQARLLYETAAKLLGPPPRAVEGAEDTGPPEPVADFAAHRPPLNPRLVMLYEQTEDRLALVHACLNAARLRNGRPGTDMPYWGERALRDGWRTGAQACLDDADWCTPQSPYRYLFLVRTAQELANEVRGLGAALLAAYEKGDAEYLAALRTTHERQLQELALETRQHLWREADWQVQALEKTKELTQTRHRYYTLLIQNGLSNREYEYEELTRSSNSWRVAANVTQAIAQVSHAVPDIYIGFPSSLSKLPVGDKMAGLFGAAALISRTVAEVQGTTAGLRLTQAGFERREEEWRHQVELLDLELEQIERQLLAAERRRDVALHELNNQQLQVEQSAEVQDFLRDKFTGHQLYLWLQRETAALHQEMYELALHAARQAERAFNYERGHTTRSFLPTEPWDQLREGLLAGDRLQLALRQMEHAYLDANAREYELTKHFSLRLHFPLAFLQLQATGACEIELPEWMFDLDYPGHYLRRVKNVSLTVPCVVGPYTGVHCRLTLLSSATRVHPHLADPPHACCPDGRPGNGYEALPDDPRIVNQYAATEAIATSTGNHDAGRFELSFQDERYLPFEFAGAVSRWRIELPRENNQFDVDTVADVVLHLNYTAREGGDVLRRAANELAQRHLPGAGLRYLDVQHDLPDAWNSLQRPPDQDGSRPVPLRLSRGMFPYLSSEPDLQIDRIELFFEARGADPSAHHLVQFLEPSPSTHDQHPVRPDECELREIHCVASADWPGLYHGVLDEITLGPLGRTGDQDLGTFRFPAALGTVSRAFLFCSYKVSSNVASDHRQIASVIAVRRP